MDFRLASLAVALFGIDEAIFKDAGGQATDILLLCSVLGQLRDLLPKFESASFRLPHSHRLEIYEELKDSFYKLEKQATDIREIWCNGSIEPSGLQHCDNVKTQGEVPESLNSIRAALQSHIQTLQKVIGSSESQATPSPSDRNRRTRVDAHNEPWEVLRANMATRRCHRDGENLVEHPPHPNAAFGLRKHQSFDYLPYIPPTDRERIESVCTRCRDREELLHEPRDAIKDREKQLHESRKVLEDEEKRWDKSHDASKDKEKQLEELREAIKDKQKQLEELREAIKAKEKQLHESHEAVKDKDKQLHESCETINALEQKYRALKHECWALEIDQFRTLKLDGDNAEKLYEKLKNKSEEFGEEPNHKAKVLSLNSAYVDMQIEREDYPRAEKVATETWEQHKDEDTDDSRRSYRQLCKALRQQGSKKYEDLERLLRQTWPAGNKTHLSKPFWILENGDELCSVLELRLKFEMACALWKNLWRERKKRQGKRHKDTIQTGIRASRCILTERAAFEKGWGTARKEAAYENAMEIVKEIWELQDPTLPSETQVVILTAGHLLGYLHYCQRAYPDAKRVLEVVWQKRKALCTQSPEETMLTGHYLSQTHFQLKNYQMARSVFEQVWYAMKFVCREKPDDPVLHAYHLSIDFLENHSTTASETQSVREGGNSHLPFETLKAWFEIGLAVLSQGKYEDAARILQEVYNAYRAAPEAEVYYKDIFTCGYYLAEAIAKQENGGSKATTILEKVLEEQTQHGTNDELEVLECRHLYGCLLKEVAESQSPSPNELFQKAEGELKRVWQTRSNINRPGLDCSRMLKAGYYLVSTMISLRQISDAQVVLGQVWEFEKGAAEEYSLSSVAFCRNLGISLMGLGGNTTVTKELEMATNLFQRVWDASKGPPRLIGVLEDGCYLGSCRMRQVQYPQAKEVLEEVAEMIADAQLRDRDRLPIDVRHALAQCESEVQARSNREAQVQSNRETQAQSNGEAQAQSNREAQAQGMREDPVHGARESHYHRSREGPVHNKRKLPVESIKAQRRGDPKRREGQKGWLRVFNPD